MQLNKFKFNPYLYVILLAALSSLSSNGAEIKKDSWKCKVKYTSTIGKNIKNRMEYSAGKDHGSTHIFTGVGKKILELVLENEKDGNESDKFVQVQSGSQSWTYLMYSEFSLVMWRFYPTEMIATKHLSYITPNSLIQTSVSWYDCYSLAK